MNNHTNKGDRYASARSNKWWSFIVAVIGGFMPKQFDRCVKSGGRVRTKKVNKEEYMHICFAKGKSYAGEVRRKKSDKRS